MIQKCTTNETHDLLQTPSASLKCTERFSRSRTLLLYSSSVLLSETTTMQTASLAVSLLCFHECKVSRYYTLCTCNELHMLLQVESIRNSFSCTLTVCICSLSCDAHCCLAFRFCAPRLLPLTPS